MKLPEEISVSVKDVPEVIKQFEIANKEIERLNNIIKEVREYIENGQAFDISFDREFAVFDRKELLKILDKEKDNESNRFIK